MPDFTPEQQQFIAKCRESRRRCWRMAVEASELRLEILSAEWQHIEDGLSKAIANQERAFRDGTLAEGAQLDFNHKTEEPQS